VSGTWWRLTSVVKVQGRVASNSVLMLRKAALAGFRESPSVPLYCVTEDLKCGALREILSRFPIPRAFRFPWSFVRASQRRQKIRSLGDFLRRLVAKQPIPYHRGRGLHSSA